MSIVKNQNHRYWKDVEAQLRCKRFTYDKEALNETDTLVYSGALALWAVSSYEVFSSLDPLINRGSTRRWILSIARYPVKDVATSLKSILSQLRIYVDSSFDCDYTDFKHQCGAGLSGLILSFVKSEVSEFLRSRDPISFRRLNTFVCFITKVNLSGVKTLHNQTLKSYIDLEDNYPGVRNWDIVSDMRDVMSEWMKPLDMEVIIPCHSGGATAECNRIYGKRRKYYVHNASDRLAYFANRYGFEYEYTHVSPPAKLITVPKGLDKRRLISPEPTLNQYWQQAILGPLDRLMRSIPQIKIHDQSQNRQLALDASYNQQWGTIDLSSASDLVSWELVKRVFSGNSRLLQALYCTRTQFVRPSKKGRLVPLQKFAPMGSALCFPIESLIFACVCEVWNRRKGTHYMYSVYGDDIICHESIFWEVLRSLEDLGFSVNLDKTFDPYCRFKESCGIEAISGYDVTPMRLPRNFSMDLIDYYYDDDAEVQGHSPRAAKYNPSIFGGLMTLANRLFDYGLLDTRNYLISSILDTGICPLFGDSMERGIYSPTPTNWHAKRRYNTLLQREEILVDTICINTSSEYDDIAYYDRLCYMAKTRRTSLLHPDDRLITSVDPVTVVVKKKWVTDTFDLHENDNGELRN